MSGRKNSLIPIKLITNGDMSASIVSSVFVVPFLDNLAVQLTFTGDPTGTFNLQGSLSHSQDDYGNVTNAGSWVSLTLLPAPVAAGAGDDILIDITELSFPYIRVIYTRVSGTGTLNCWGSGKMI